MRRANAAIAPGVRPRLGAQVDGRTVARVVSGSRVPLTEMVPQGVGNRRAVTVGRGVSSRGRGVWVGIMLRAGKPSANCCGRAGARCMSC